MPFERELRKLNTAVERPHLGRKAYKIAQCEVQLNDAGAYNSHMRDIHGVRTEVQEGGTLVTCILALTTHPQHLPTMKE